MKHTLVTIAASLLLSTSAWAGALTVPNTFTAGTPARAAQVNANFTAAKTSVDDNNTRITTNTASAATNATNITANTTAIAAIPAPDTANQVRDKFFAGTSCTNPNNPNDVMVKVGPLCVDKYEASIWSVADGTGTTYGVFAGQTAYPASFPANGNWTAPLYAASMPGVFPSTGVTWFQAQQACFASGKRLLSNAEWQAVAAGTPDPGLGGNAATCNNFAGTAVVTGKAVACVSKWGVMDMVGNAWEWVGDWVQGGINPWASTTANITGATYGNDAMYGMNPAVNQGAGSTNMPAALLRGGYWTVAPDSGVFALSANAAPSAVFTKNGFRCAR